LHPDRALTALAVKQMKAPGRFADGHGLYLVVDPSGAKRWLLRLVVQGRRRDIGLGSVSLVPLAEAREKAIAFRKVAREGGDPLLVLRLQPVSVPTFSEAAEQVHAAQELTWKNPKHAQQWINTLKSYAFPIIGKKPVSEVQTPDILAVLSPIWLSKPETGRRVRQRIGTVLDWAKAAGHRTGDNPVEAVGRGLPRQPTGDKHHAALSFKDVPDFVATLRRAGEGSNLAFEFLILTATRTSEVLNAVWAEIDLNEKVWTLPAERMKAGRVHRIPLSARSLEILASAKAWAPDSELVFPNQTGKKPFSNMVFQATMKRLEAKATPHGFRSAFSDWAAETTSFPREVVEMALAHTVKNKVEAAYRRGDLFDKRRELMDAWQNFIIGEK
jgi:integrase